MKVIVTGASGFIGNHVLKQLQQKDFSVHAISRNPQKSIEGITWHSLDLFDSDAVTSFLKSTQASHLLHLAWDVTHGAYWNSVENFHWVKASLHLLTKFRELGGMRAVVAGTCAEYDWGYGYLREVTTPLNPNSPYGVCKASLYHMLTSYSQQTELSFAWGRIFFTFGLYEHPSRVIPYVIQSLMAGKTAELSSGDQIRDFMYVKDVAAAFASLLTHDLQGSINISSANPIRLKQMALSIADKLNKPDKLLFGACESDKYPLVVGDNKRLRDELNFLPTYSIDEALDETIEWWQQRMRSNNEKD